MPRFHDRLRLQFKYDGIRLPRKVPDWVLGPQDLAQVDFDLRRLGPRGIVGRLRQAAGRWVMHLVLRLLQRFWPRCRIGKLLILTRHDDVTLALNRPKVFAGHYEPEMRLIANRCKPGADMSGDLATFMLAIDDTEAHRRQHEPVREALSDADLTDAFHATTKLACESLLRNGDGRIDVIKDYFTRSAAEAGIALLGLEVDDPDSFADWTLAVSTMIFGDPFGNPVVRELAQYGGWRLRAAADRAIHLAKPGGKKGKQPVSLVAALVEGRRLEIDEIRAILIGTAIGLIPTVTLAAGNIIEWLLKHPETMALARKAARGGDRAKLRRILEEVARLRPALDPGQFRYVDRDEDYVLPSGPVRIPAGTVALVSTSQALRDPRVYPDPGHFRLDRPAPPPTLMFGAGMHACLGQELALDQMTTMFECLLSKEGLRPVKGRLGRVQRVGPFPRRLDFRYGPAGEGRDAPQSMITIVVPVSGSDPDFIRDLEDQVAKLGNPASAPMTAALESTGIVHFCSLSLLDVGKPKEHDWRLILEISADGEESVVLERVAAIEDSDFRRIFVAAGYDRGFETFAEFLGRHRLDVRPHPWGTTGLLYNGSAGFSVKAKEDQAALAAFATEALQYHMQNPDNLRNEPVGDVRPIGAIRFIRDLLLIDNLDIIRARMAGGVYTVPPAIVGEQSELKRIHTAARELDRRHMLFLPSRERLPFLEWRQLSFGQKMRRYLGSPSKATIICAALLALTTIGSLIWLGLVNGPDPALPARTGTAAKLLFGLALAALVAEFWSKRRSKGWSLRRPSIRRVAAAMALAGLATIAFVPTSAAAVARPAALTGAFAAVALLAILLGATLCTLGWLAAFIWLRRLEETDRPDERDPDLDLRRAIGEKENAPGCEQNHILSCSDFKVGPLRRFTFALAMWGIDLFCRYWTRPGFILSMGTIHFARWFRLPRAGKLVFLSNYDGSWESYLEDFITKAHRGQTAAWTHGEGFPRTRALTDEGARNGDRFKRWVRRQQRVTHFWYSRFPELTQERIRINALIHEGLARAATDTQAREWLALFGSAPRPEATIETHEVQTLLFQGLPRRPQGAYMFFQFGEDAGKNRQLLKNLITAGPGLSTESDWTRPCVTFGELQSGTPLKAPVVALGLSSRGLTRLQLPGPRDPDGLASFPQPFVLGMRARHRILGDPQHAKWRWQDQACHAVLILLAYEPKEKQEEGQEQAWHEATDRDRTRDRDPWEAQRLAMPEAPAGENAKASIEKGVQALKALIEGAECTLVVEPIFTEPVPFTAEDPKTKEKIVGRSRYRDHFGFRDGLSQPAIRGTATARRALPNDIVEPGEFILGYRSNQGYVAPSLRISVDNDPNDILPDTSRDPDGNFPAFRHGDMAATPFRDFGRNGSFLVIRQITQDVEGFHRFAADAAAYINRNYRGLADALQQPIDSKWVEAKIVGRWADGTPLIDRADQPRGGWHNPRNDFSFAKDDPRGFGCPLGAHVRRANPRDSLDWDDPRAITIANRHRMIRRGRHYQLPNDDEKGLMFTAICGDLERQFEFVMQRWIRGSFFHGLERETDPLATRSEIFTIPTPVGPVKLKGLRDWTTTVGGGYFFLPSRAALRYLADATRPPLPAPLAPPSTRRNSGTSPVQRRRGPRRSTAQ